MGASSVKVSVKSHQDEITESIKDAIETALTEIGLVAQRYASESCPVKTGRLAGSITYATKKEKSDVRPPKDGEANPSDGVSQKQVQDKYTVVIGSNVEYAEIMELKHATNNRFLTKAANGHRKEYGEILQRYIDQV